MQSIRGISAGVVVCILLLAGAGSCATVDGAYFDEQAKQAVRSQARDPAYLVDVGSRVIDPSLGNPISYAGGRALVYLQFERPLASAERGKIIRLGVKFYAALSGSTYLAKVKPSALPSLVSHPLIRGIEMVEPADKLTEALYKGTVGLHAINPDGTWSVQVQFFDDVKLKQALKVLDRAGVQTMDRTRLQFNSRMLVHAMPHQVLALAESPAVRSIEEVAPPPKANNLVAAQLSNVDDVRAAPFNLNGTGVPIGIWDEGPVRANHPDLTPRVTNVETDNTQGDHSTHVAGTMISSGANNANAIGMAPAAGQLFGYDFDDNTATEQSNAVADHGIRIANHSWGTTIGWDDGNNTGNTGLFGRYNGTAADYDTLVRATGLIVVKSSGNDRNDCDPGDATNCDGVLGADGQRYDTIGTHGNAKNVITVGAVNDDTTIAGFSSSGPADDNRIKPDVVANGVGLTSTWNGGTTIPGGCDGMDYCSISGTSMSSPVVSGICALLEQRYRQRYGGADISPDIVKALLVNTATDLGRPGPDYLFGYGLVNALPAVQTIDVGPVRIITDSVDHGQVDEFLLGVRAGVAELRVTLNWLDPAGTANSGDPDIVNNLDLTVFDPSGVAHFPFSSPGAAYTNNATNTGANTRDTVEQVVVDVPQGFWLVRVAGAAVPDGPQNYALVANASFSLPDEPDIRVAFVPDFDEICPGDTRTGS